MANTSASDLHPEKIRQAAPDEIERVALVAAAGFYFSPANAYERPKRDQYARDTFESYRHEMLSCLWSRERILVVAEDNFDRSEDDELYTALREAYGGRDWKLKDGRLVVGFACLTLKKGSSREGEFMPPGDVPNIPDESEVPKRDQNPEGLKKLSDAIEQPMQEYFGGEFQVDMLAVHPRYWRKRHGSSLLLWATQLADKDSIKLGVAAVPMAIHICCKVGFAKKDEVEVEGYSEHPEGFKVWIGVREPTATTSITKAIPQVGWSLSCLLTGVRNLFSK